MMIEESKLSDVFYYLKQQPLLNIEEVDWSNKRQKLTSPRSKQACKRLGIKLNDLYYKDFNQFKSDNLAIINLPKEAQQLRWEHYEEKRIELINMVKEERDNIIKEQIKENSKEIETNDKSKSFESMSQNSQFKLSAIENERKAMEKIKQRQKQEIQSIIENELKMSQIRQENEEKMIKQIEKEEKMQKRLLELRNQQEEKKRKKDFERDQQLIREFKEQERKNYEKFLEEQRKIENQKEKERKFKKDKIKREIEQKEKLEKFKQHTEKIYLEQQMKIKKRQLEMEERDRIRIEISEKKRIQTIIDNNRRKEEHDKKLEINKIKMGKKLREQREDFEKKQLLNEEKKKINEEIREEKIMRQKENSLKKQVEINRVLELNKRKDREKINDYFAKQEEMEEYKHKIEMNIEKELIMRKTTNREKELKVKSLRKKNNIEEIAKVNDIIEKMSHLEERIRIKYENEERNAILNREKNAMKREDKSKTVERISLIEEYKKEIAIEAFIEKSSRIEEIKKQKIEKIMKRKQLADNISKKKREIIEKFDKTIKGNKEMNNDLIRELFPGDEGDNLIEKINHMKSSGSKSLNRTTRSSMSNKPNYNNVYSYKNNKNIIDSREIKSSDKNSHSLINNSYNYNKTTQNNYNTKIDSYIESSSHQRYININDTQINSEYNNLKELPDIEYLEREQNKGPGKNILIYQDPNNKLEVYKKKLNQELLNVLDEEKKKEEERQNLYDNTHNSEEKKELERLITNERIKSSQKIIDLNQGESKRLRE